MKLKYIPAIFLLIAGTYGCTKYIERDAVGLLTDADIQVEPRIGTVTSYVNRSYQMLSTTFNLIGEWEWNRGTVFRPDVILQDIAAADMQKKWNPDGDQAWMDEFSNFAFTADNPGFNGIWSFDYEGISRVNTALSYLNDNDFISKVGMDDATRKRMQGEMYFLRAFYYFDLVNYFGGVPLMLKPIATIEEAYEAARRATAEEVWTQIRADLSEAKNLLPNAKYSDPNDRWRVSKGAVIAMQAKVALYNKQWDEVVTLVTELQGLNYYNLNANYFDAFDITKEYNENEVIFAYNHTLQVNPRNGNGLNAVMGWGFIAPTTDFVNAFEANDPRLPYTIDVNAQASYKLLGEIGTGNKGNEDAPSNKIFIRFADVLLWKAEAYNELNNPGNAIQIINQIRQRARTSPMPGGGNPPAGTLPDRNVNETNKDVVRNWIYQERRVELGFESHRYNDLRRWGIARDYLRNLGRDFQDRHYLYPIPQGEVDRSGGSIPQNDY